MKIPKVRSKMTAITLQSNWMTAHIEFDRYDRAVRVAPILHYMKGWPKDRVVEYAKRRGWTVAY